MTETPTPETLPFQAVLWDMDGTLVDTEPYWIETEYALAEAHGATWSQELALQLVGNDLLDSGRFIKEQMGLDLTPEEIVDFLLDGVVERVRHHIPWRPGARVLLTELRAADTPCALVTMSWKRFVDPILEQLPAGTFQVVVTGDQVAHGKPHPEPYLKAAAELGVDPAQCLAIEDSGPGATSAEAAGCLVLVVPHHVPVPVGPRRIRRTSLTEMTRADLESLTPPG